MTDRLVLGVDPGLDGGLVMLDEGGALIEKSVMPVVKLKKGRMVCFQVLLFERLMEWKPDIVIIEAVTTNPSMGHSSAFKFGRAYQTCIDATEACRYRYELIHPRKWQKEIFGATPGIDTKAAARNTANRLWPMADFRATEKCKIAHDGIVDAACIAEYGRRILL